MLLFELPQGLQRFLVFCQSARRIAFGVQGIPFLHDIVNSQVLIILLVCHSGKYCYGKTPMQTFLDSKHLAKEKALDQLLAPQSSN